jgi:NADPH:quinone reductase-like Zn-dependent oxidoreductase
MGLECSGLVVSVGSKVENLKVSGCSFLKMFYVFSFIKFTVFFPIQEGDRVMVHTGTPGLQTEFVCVEASDCTVIPESMSFNEAAAFPINYLTAYFCLFDIGNLRSSQTVLIPSAAGKK